MAKSKIFCVFDPDCVPICLGEIGIDLHGVNGTGSTGDGGSMTAEPAVWHFLNTTSAAHTAHASAALHEPILVSATKDVNRDEQNRRFCCPTSQLILMLGILIGGRF